MRVCLGYPIPVLAALGCCLCLLAPAMVAAEPPLSKDVVTFLLQYGPSSEKIITMVQERGISFRMDPDFAQQLDAAGASDELIDALWKASESVESAPPGSSARDKQEKTGNRPTVATTPPSTDRAATQEEEKNSQSEEQEKSPSKVFTNDDVLKLLKAGFGEEVIVEAIRRNDCRLDTSADALIALKNAGASDKVIMAVLASGRTWVSSPESTVERDDLPDGAGLYILKDGEYLPAEFEPVNWRSGSGDAHSSDGLTTIATLTASMATLESPVRLSGDLEFLLICAEEDATAIDYQLLRAEDSKKGREFRVEFQLLDNGDYASMGATSKDTVDFSGIEVALGKFRLKLPALAKGEYAFLPPTLGTNGRLYTFGVR